MSAIITYVRVAVCDVAAAMQGVNYMRPETWHVPLVHYSQLVQNV